jgi:hypothetical protein
MKHKIGWLLIGIGALGYVICSYELLKSFAETYHQLRSGENIVFFSGLDVFFYSFILILSVVLANRSKSKISKSSLFILFGSLFFYSFYYEFFAMRFVDLVQGESPYSICLKYKKGPKAGFGEHYVLTKSSTDCDKFAHLKDKNFTNRQLEQHLHQIKESNLR